MGSTDFLHLLGAFAAAFVAGAINSVAGGGTMVSFPILIALGLPPVIANATNTAGIWWGSLGSVWGFREEIARVPKVMRWFLLPAAIGSVIGALLLRCTPAGVFDRLVPWLILFATVLFILQAPIQKRLKSAEAARAAGKKWMTIAVVAQIAVAIYGGYFGAGMSIMMLSILAICGMTDILEMSGMTSLLSISINGVAGILFAFSHLIFWPYAVAMGIGAIVGGYGAAGIAKKIGKTAVRRFVIGVGVTMAIVMFVRLTRHP